MCSIVIREDVCNVWCMESGDDLRTKWRIERGTITNERTNECNWKCSTHTHAHVDIAVVDEPNDIEPADKHSGCESTFYIRTFIICKYELLFSLFALSLYSILSYSSFIAVFFPSSLFARSFVFFAKMWKLNTFQEPNNHFASTTTQFDSHTNSQAYLCTNKKQKIYHDILFEK